ncbi:Intradiol ring-cleavage dioxygenase [Xylariomycetidae sp. FL0641]|nr:Intradiol ring-cleavage dioxygenase [Xylariomycetidae sp. FL0641]
MVNFSRSLLVTALAAGEVLAHPGANHKLEAERRAAAMSKVKTRSLGDCHAKMEARDVNAMAAQRRAAAVQQLTKKSIVARDYPDVLNVSHHSNLDVDQNVDPVVLFSGNNSCALIPETTQGPYYVTGEMIRSDVVEDQVGVPLYIDVQVIDTNTCEPLEGVAMDFWSCNATGQYSGIASQAGLDTTWLRGIQVSDAEGVVSYQSIMPGHYAGRTHHLHLLAHSPGNWTKLANGTITGGNSTPHIGQVFFDQDLVDELETLEPYSTNTQQWTLNDEDNIVKQEAEQTGVDPMANYVLLGDSLADGVFAWVSIGLDPTAQYEVDAAVQRVEGGGIVDDCFEMINLTPDDPALPPLPASCSSSPATTSTAAAAA